MFLRRSLFREATGIVEGQQEVAKGTTRAALDKAKAEDESTKLRKVCGVFRTGHGRMAAAAAAVAGGVAYRCCCCCWRLCSMQLQLALGQWY